MKPHEAPELRIKAYAGRVLLAFFQRKVAALISEPGIDDPELVLLHGVLTSMCQWFLKVESAGRYLSAEEAQIIWDTHLQFLALITLPWLGS